VPVCALHSLVEIRENHAPRVAALSYANTLSLGLTVDSTVVVDVDDLAEDMRIEAAALIASAKPR
jgi:WS/DGAT C-terminal domain